jgi:polyhydroxyalkanoate synthesis repressor PhaR
LETQATHTGTDSSTLGASMSSPKVIKRYQNRKLYDTQQSCYVTLEDIAKMIRQSEEVTVVDNKTKRDITASTLSQIIFEAEKKAADYAPLSVLRSIIQNGNGSMSSYLAKLGVFTQEAKKAPETEFVVEQPVEAPRASYDSVRGTLDQRIQNATDRSANTSAPTATPSQEEGELTPQLPTPNNGLNN